MVSLSCFTWWWVWEARSTASWCVKDVHYVHGSDMILDSRESIWSYPYKQFSRHRFTIHECKLNAKIIIYMYAVESREAGMITELPTSLHLVFFDLEKCSRSLQISSCLEDTTSWIVTASTKQLSQVAQKHLNLPIRPRTRLLQLHVRRC